MSASNVEAICAPHKLQTEGEKSPKPTLSPLLPSPCTALLVAIRLK